MVPIRLSSKLEPQQPKLRPPARKTLGRRIWMADRFLVEFPLDGLIFAGTVL